MMQATNPPATLFWGVVRSLLGILQMAGAIVSVVLCLRNGAMGQTAIAVASTLAVTLISILLFRVMRVGERRLN